MPRPFRIDSEIALPNSISLDWLIDPANSTSALNSRQERAALLEGMKVVKQSYNGDQNYFTQQVPIFFWQLAQVSVRRDFQLDEDTGLIQDFPKFLEQTSTLKDAFQIDRLIV